MKRVLSFIVATMFAGQAWAVDDYDFSAVCSSGQTLYYKIKNDTEVEVTYPKHSSSDYYSGYTKPSGNMVIPDAVTYPETDGATYTVTSIGYDAFRDCSGLTSVTIPNSVTSIGDFAFYYCCSLTSVTIPNSVTSIGEYAFYCCSGLTSVTIPNSVTSINRTAFIGCSKLIDINVEIDNTKYASENGVLFNKEKTNLLRYPAGKSGTTYIIQNTVTSIGDYAFYGCRGLTTITIGNSVTDIGYEAFSYCSGLTSVTIPNSVTSIRNSAFINCSKLKDINVEIDNTKYASENGVLFNAEKTNLLCYPAGKPGTTYIIQNTVTSIGDYAFYGCSGFTSITIPNSVTSIGNYAFYGCSGLTSFSISNFMTSFGVDAFTGCGNLLKVYDNARYVGTTENPFLVLIETKSKGIKTCEINSNCIFIANNAFSNCRGLASVTIPNSVTNIGSSAFAFCIALTSVNIPESVTSIGDYAFTYCSKLTTIIIPNSVINVGSNVFNRCSSLTSVSISESVTNIGDYAFSHCALTSVTIPNSVTSIGSYAFEGCSKLTAVIISNSVTSIGGSAFRGCSRLASVTIPNSVTNIEDGAFFDCSGLTSITIPNSVISIGKNAFGRCSALTSLCYDGSKEPTFTIGAFSGVDKTIPVCVPSDYSSNSWCGFTNLYKGHDIVTDPATVTCTEAGLTEGSHCSKCGRVFVAQEEVAALGHTVVADVAIDPTCTEPGKTAGKHCSICNAVLEGLEVIPATGHTYSNTITAPTCTAVGFTTHTCSVCEYTYYSDTIDAKGHKADSVEFENIIPATCTAAGSKDSVVFCSVCEVELSRDEKEIAALGHTYSSTVTAPTCTAVGYTTHTCSVCEYTYYSDTVDAKGHKADSVEFENVVPATCTADGSKDSVVFCSVCEVELSREKRGIPALGHSYSSTVTAPTCTEIGYTTHTCSVCENTYNSDTVDAKGHTEVIDAAVPATCTAAGKTEGKHCPVCNETIVAQTEIPALGHEFKDYVYNNDATTAADGTETATCTRGCGATDTRPAAGTKLAETPEKGTAVAESAANAITIYAHHNIIVVENATDEISVYNAMGTLISRDATPCVRAEINVNAPGIYIVKAGNTTKRLVIQ